MSVAVNSPTPFLPITSLQLQHLQAVTYSFARRRPIISSVFNDFRTLSIATGGGTLPCQVFVASELAASALLCFHVLPNCFFFSERPALPRQVSFNLLALTLHADERAVAAVFSVEKNAKFSRGTVPIQCCISPFNARKNRS